MNERPKRERKPTQPFQYINVSAKSTIATVSSIPTKRSPNKRRTGGTLSRGVTRGRDRNRGPGRGRGRGLNKSANTLSTRRYSPTLNSDELSDDNFLFSDPVNDAGALANDPDDLDFAKEDETNTNNITTVPQREPASRRRRILFKGPLLTRRRGEEDDVIEQWYADPYERINPNGIAYDQWRFTNLHILLQNRGYSKLNAKSMAVWLMKCNGYYKEYTAPVRKSRAKKPTKPVSETPGADEHRSVTSGADIHQDEVDQDNDEEDCMTSTQGEHLSQQEPDTAFAAFQASMLSHTDESDFTTHHSEKENSDHIVGTKPDQSSHTSFGMSSLTIEHVTPGTTKLRNESEEQNENEDAFEALQAKSRELNDLLKLENLKRCLKVFHAVYGPDGPQHHPGQFEHNYFSQNSTLPALVPKAGLRTQAHFALQTVPVPADNPAFFNDAQRGGSQEATSHARESVNFRNVFTEDPDFGITYIRKSERATEADMKLYYAQFDRVKVGRPAVVNDPDLHAEADTDDNNDLAKPILDPTVIKLQNEESAKVISEQLQQKVFDWESPSTMFGGIPKKSKDDNLRDGQFALKERHIWKELRRRQQILDEGGEGAAKLLEEEWEEAQRERKREKRRLESARVKEKRKAVREAERARWGAADMGMRKRVKFSEEVSEEW